MTKVSTAQMGEAIVSELDRLARSAT